MSYNKKTNPMLFVAAAALAVVFGLAQVPEIKADSAPHIKVTVCHATASESNPFTTPTVNVNSAGVASGMNGHRGHEGDIIPLFVYDGVTYLSQGDQSLYASCSAQEPEEEDVYGCTDPEADNYDPEATIDDDSCEYPNGNDVTPTPTPTCNPGSVVVDGDCHHPQATNYVDDSTSGTGGPSSNDGAVLGATTGQVLGASTLAGTGSAAENMAIASMFSGALLAIISLYAKKAILA